MSIPLNRFTSFVYMHCRSLKTTGYVLWLLATLAALSWAFFSTQRVQERIDIESDLLEALNSTDTAIISSDPQGIIRKCNDKAKAIFGYDAKELINKSIASILPTSMTNQHAQRYTEAFARSSSFHIVNVQCVGLNKWGNLVDILVRVHLDPKNKLAVALINLRSDTSKQIPAPVPPLSLHPRDAGMNSPTESHTVIAPPAEMLPSRQSSP